MSSPQKIPKKRKRNDAKSDAKPDAISSKKLKRVPEPLVEEWSQRDLTTLIDNVISLLPKKDILSYASLAEKYEWDKVKFDGYSAEDCKKQWKLIVGNLRRYRTMTEMATDAKEWVKKPWEKFGRKMKPPGLPKRPMTSYFLYLQENRAKLAKKNPDLKVTDLASVAAREFKNLPEKQKKKYLEAHEAANENFKVQMEKYKAEHPDMYPVKGDGPTKPKSPYQLFVANKGQGNHKSEWIELEDKEKVRWIKKALKNQKKFDAKLAEYRKTHPDFEPDFKKSAVTKAEIDLMEKLDGKPGRPPATAFALYSSEFAKDLKGNLSQKEKKEELTKRWEELTVRKQKEYAERVKELKKSFKRKMESYEAKVSKEEKEKNQKKGKSKGAELLNRLEDQDVESEDESDAKEDDGRSKIKKDESDEESESADGESEKGDLESGGDSDSDEEESEDDESSENGSDSDD